MIKSAAFGTMFAVSTMAAALNLSSGWNLVGNNSAGPINVATTFADPAKVTTVWKWNKQTSKWGFYSPTMNNAALATYVKERGYEQLIEISVKEGYWINGSSGVVVTPEGTSAPSGSDLSYGWNLVVGTAGNTPGQLADTLNGGLNAAGQQVSTIWAWDNASAKWKFYSPVLAAQGGTALADYISSKGYKAFGTISGSEGIWVNVETGVTPPVVEPIKLDCLTEYINPANGWEVGATALAPPINATVNDDYSISQGPWGSRNISGWSLCTGAVMANSNKVTGRITWDYGSISLQPNWVVSYPNISFGNIPGHTNPVTVANFPAPIAITKSIIATWDVEMRNVTGTGNTAFDIWISSDGKADTVAYGKSTTVMELMIRTDSRGNYTKWAEIFPNDPTVVIDGVAYQYHFDPVAPMVNDVRSDYINPTMATFIAKQTITKGSVDIMSFIKFLQGKGLLTNEYIQNIEFGMELATGKGEMLINSYSVTVN